MKTLTLAIVALTILGAGIIATPTAEASDCSPSPSSPLICPVGSIPYYSGDKEDCGSGGWTCVWLW